MKLENHYCCRCHRTTRFQVEQATFVCTGCGKVFEKTEQQPQERSLVGNPLRSFKIRSGD